MADHPSDPAGLQPSDLTRRASRGVVGVDYHRDWNWSSAAAKQSPADLSPGSPLWLAIGDAVPVRVTVLGWVDARGERRLVVRFDGGRSVAIGRLGAWFVRDDGPIAHLIHGEAVQVNAMEDGQIGASLPMGHIWPPDAIPPAGPPERGRGRRT